MTEWTWTGTVAAGTDFHRDDTVLKDEAEAHILSEQRKTQDVQAKLAAAEKSKAEWMIEWEGMNAAATDMLINSTHEVVVKERKRIAELETERAALLAEVKRLTDILGTKTFIRSDQIKPSGDAKRDPISPRDPLERV